MRSSPGDPCADTVAHQIETLDVPGQSAESRGLTRTRHGGSRRGVGHKSASRAALGDGIRLHGHYTEDLRVDRRERVGDGTAGRFGGDLRERFPFGALLHVKYATQFPYRRQRQAACHGVRGHVY